MHRMLAYKGQEWYWTRARLMFPDIFLLTLQGSRGGGQGPGAIVTYP